jgi:type IV secretory pathway VirB2 component (pilin)
MRNYYKKTISLFSFWVIILLVSSPANAEIFLGFGLELCRLKACFLSNNVIMVVGSLAVFFLGIGVFMGKVSWPLALATCIGLILITGSNQIAQMFMGSLTGLTLCSIDEISNGLGELGCVNLL